MTPIYAGRIRHKEKIYPGLHPPIIDPDTWDRVQEQIAANRQGNRYRVTAQEPSLLAGLLVDGNGTRFVPSHAVKQGRRYRYYIHESLSHRNGTKTRGQRWPAQELEAAVQRALRDLLGDAPRLLELFGTNLSGRNSSQILAGAAAKLQELPGFTPSAWCAMLVTVIERIQLGDENLQITMRPRALGDSLGCSLRDLPHESVVVSVPIQIRQRGIQLRVIVPSERRPSDPRIDTVLIRLIVRAMTWRQQLEGGGAQSLRDLAVAESISEAFVGRVLRLAYLAPGIIEAIIDGQQPVGLTAQDLLYRADLPVSWQHQHRGLGLLE